MAETRTATALTEKVWVDKFFQEYVRENQFAGEMGTGLNNIIVVKEEMTTRAGDRISIPIINRLRSAGVSGTTVLDGNEEEMDMDGHAIVLDWIRHGVVITKADESLTKIDLYNAARDELMRWCTNKMRDDIIASFQKINTGETNVKYSDASEAQKDAHAVANSDRILYGAVKGNYSGDNSVDLAKCDTSNDTLRTSIVSLARRMARDAVPAIVPYRINGWEEWYVMYTTTRALRDLRAESAMQQANREAMERGRDNPLFRPGDLMWDGVIVKEIPEIPILSGVGNSGADVSPCFLCGAGAVGVAWGQRPTPVLQEKDYRFRKGVGIEKRYGVDKITYLDPTGTGTIKKQHGMVTVYVASAADS